MSFADDSLLRRRPGITTLLKILLIGVLICVFHSGLDAPSTDSVEITAATASFFNAHRKLLQAPEGSKVETERVWRDKCDPSDIMITQGPTEPMPNGIPMYTVEISNISPTGSDISAIHVSCGWFSSARLVNPKVFKRLYYDNCLVNDGKPLVNGGTVSFQYANTYSYRLIVNSVRC